MRDGVPARMRALVLAAPGRCELREIPTPSPTAEQVLVRIEGCGVCGSNLPLWEGREWFSYPTAPGSPGHEAWGTIVAVGSEVRALSVGERVAMLSERGFADYDVANASSVVPIPRPITGDAPGEPLGCAMNIEKRSSLARGQTVAVIGVGFLGALVVQSAARIGARVIAISQRPFSLDLARRMGATDTLALEDDHGAIVRTVDELTRGELCDRVIELVGLQRPLDLATRLCRTRGRLVIAGFHQDGPRTVDMFQWNWRGLDVVNAHERDPAAYTAGMTAAFGRIVEGRLDPTPLYTHRVPLERAGDAFEMLRTRPDGFVKALVTP